MAQTGLCAIPPSPSLLAKMDAEFARIRALGLLGVQTHLTFQLPRRPGLNDAIIFPPSSFPLGTRMDLISGAPHRAPVAGTVRVLVVLVDFPDRAFAVPRQRFQDLFFSQGTIATGSVREFYTEVTGGRVTISGTVVGPYTMPNPITYYAAGRQGMGDVANSQDLAGDATNALGLGFNLAPFNNFGTGYVDAFIVIHAGTGAEQTNNPNDLWSLKWTLRRPFSGQGANIYGFLTVPEDCQLGVCAHELGHLLFGFPDLYDVHDNAYAGAGNWCLMAGGSWNMTNVEGDTPAHPSAWCKLQQSWVSLVRPGQGVTPFNLPDVKVSRQVIRVWDGPASSQEYFLLETRARTGFDRALPGEGLVIWHIDDSIGEQDNPAHWKVGLEQADGLNQLGSYGGNRGDDGDPYPGSTSDTAFGPNTNPPAKAFVGTTQIEVNNISFVAAVASFSVKT